MEGGGGLGLGSGLVSFSIQVEDVLLLELCTGLVFSRIQSKTE